MTTPKTPKADSSDPWEVHLTETAEAVYSEYYRLAADAEDRGEPQSSHCSTLRMVDEVLDKIIPHNPIDPKRALAGALSNIFRFKKGRMRIFWIASSKARKVSVLFISDTPRKEGDVHDPYELFGALVMSGKFNEVFAQLGVRIPQVARLGVPPGIQ